MAIVARTRRLSDRFHRAGFHPEFNKPQWTKVQGIENPTVFLTQFPHLEDLSLEPHWCQSLLHKQSPGWVVSGYALPQSVVKRRTITSTDHTSSLLEFAYAMKMQCDNDHLTLLGYEVVDEDDLFLSSTIAVSPLSRLVPWPDS